jgi:hypothetical protein
MQVEYWTSWSAGPIETGPESEEEGCASSCGSAQLTNMKMEKSESAILNGFICVVPFLLRRRRRVQGRYLFPHANVYTVIVAPRPELHMRRGMRPRSTRVKRS